MNWHRKIRPSQVSVNKANLGVRTMPISSTFFCTWMFSMSLAENISAVYLSIPFLCDYSSPAVLAGTASTRNRLTGWSRPAKISKWYFTARKKLLKGGAVQNIDHVHRKRHRYQHLFTQQLGAVDNCFPVHREPISRPQRIQNLTNNGMRLLGRRGTCLVLRDFSEPIFGKQNSYNLRLKLPSRHPLFNELCSIGFTFGPRDGAMPNLVVVSHASVQP